MPRDPFQLPSMLKVTPATSQHSAHTLHMSTRRPLKSTTQARSLGKMLGRKLHPTEEACCILVLKNPTVWGVCLPVPA